VKRVRLDKLLFENKLVKSRTEAQIIILSGEVKVNGVKIVKPSIIVPIDSKLTIEKSERFVSRGAYKLIKALDYFNINVEGKICADIGSSTGGFTEILLKRGAQKVYAVDVGVGQLDLKLRNDSRVTLLEGINARYLTKKDIPEVINLATIDVSFISVEKIIPQIKELGSEDLEIITLLKPQFEVGKSFVGKNGIIRNKEYIIDMLNKKFDFFYKIDLPPKGLTFSPIKGAKGNIEYLIFLKREPPYINKSIIEEVVNESWNIFQKKT